jgi:hypothetical protein
MRCLKCCSRMKLWGSASTPHRSAAAAAGNAEATRPATLNEHPAACSARLTCAARGGAQRCTAGVCLQLHQGRLQRGIRVVLAVQQPQARVVADHKGAGAVQQLRGARVRTTVVKKSGGWSRVLKRGEMRKCG